MRRGRDGAILTDDAGKVVAVNLGADYCAEHEWGIKDTRRAFGMKDDGYGIDRRKVRKSPELLDWCSVKIGAYRDRKSSTLACEGLWFFKYDFARKDGPGLEGGLYGDSNMWTGWSDGDFGAFSADAKEKVQLRDVFAALTALDACIWLGGGGVFQNAGLVIGVASRLPAEVTEGWDRHDRETEKLKQDAAATGIEARLKAAGKSFFALSPRREKDGSVIFWLNPMEQRQNNGGWFTVADLDDWIAGRGKVPMKRKESA